MIRQLHPGPHLDADQLAAFAEGALSDRERQESLVHLAECAKCREIAFLALEPQQVPVMQPAKVSLPFWRTFGAVQYGVAAACALAITISFLIWEVRVPVANPKVAQISSAPALPAPSAATAPLTPESAQSSRTVTRRSAAQKEVAKARERGAHAVTPHADDARAYSKALAYDSPAAEAKSQSSESLPLNGRSSFGLRSLAGAAPVLDAKELPPANGPISVRIEHREGSPSGLAEVAGGVMDATGAVIPGASVRLQQGANAIVRETKTDQNGRFSLTGVPTGTYNLFIASPGFNSVNRELELHASDLALLTSQLPVGSSTQTVEVTAAAPILQSEAASVAAVLSLPKGKTVTRTVSQGTRVLTLADDGTLYLSTNSGKRWKTVKPKWHGKIADVATAEDGDGFQLTTDANDVWVSADGRHWNRLGALK